MDAQKRSALAEYMRGYSAVAGLAHSSERLEELEPEVATLFDDMATLWTIPLEGTEMAVSFAVEKLADNE